MLSSANNDAEVYTVYADLFLLLFMVAVMMMGTDTSFRNLEKAGGDNLSEEHVLSIYVGLDGRLFRESGRRQFIHEKNLGELLKKESTTRVVLHLPRDLPAFLLNESQEKLESSSATEVSYLIEENQDDENKIQ